MVDMMLPYHAVLGKIVSTWDRVEGGCLHIFNAILRTPAAEAIYLCARSFELRIDMLEAAMTRTLNAARIETGKIHLDKTRKLAVERNAVIHGQWIGGATRNSTFIRLALPDDWNEAAKILGAYQTKNPKFQKQFHKHIYEMSRLEELASRMDDMVLHLFDFGNSLDGPQR